MSFLTSLLANPAIRTALMRGVMFIVAYLVHAGYIPTGIVGGGDPAAALIAATAVSIPAGDTNKANMPK